MACLLGLQASLPQPIAIWSAPRGQSLACRSRRRGWCWVPGF